MHTIRTVRLLGLLVLVVLAGCAGGADGGSSGDAGTAATEGAPATTSGGNEGVSADWCVKGQVSSFTNPESGETVSMEVMGVVDRDGRQVCRAVWETNQGEVRRMEMLFTEDQSYRRMLSYDASGEVVNEIEMTGAPTTSGDGAASGGGDGASGSADWCSAASSMSFVNPQTGEQASMEVQGIVEHEGRQVCRAVWETNQGEVRRMEMLFTEDRSYQVVRMYDEDGELLDEMEMSG